MRRSQNTWEQNYSNKNEVYDGVKMREFLKFFFPDSLYLVYFQQPD
jgi:hypothetical protein